MGDRSGRKTVLSSGQHGKGAANKAGKHARPLSPSPRGKNERNGQKVEIEPQGAGTLGQSLPRPRVLRSLEEVERSVIACDLCPRLRAHCQEIAAEKKRAFREQEYWGKPVPGFGNPDARLLIIGLAPAAHGGNRTGRIFTGDSSGSWLYEALHRYGFANQPDSTGRGDGLRLDGCYVTAAGHCAPPGNKPSREELDNCQPYLEAEMRLLRNVRVVLVLGRIAWESWMRASGLVATLSRRERPRFGHGAEADLPPGKRLLCSYHPSRQNTHTGRLTRAMWHGVIARARELVDEEV